MSSYLCMSFLSEGFFELRLHCLWSWSVWGWGVDALSHFKVNYVDTVSSSYFFLFAALFQTSGHAHTPHSCPHTYTQHELRIHATPGATKTPTGQAARRQQLTSEECEKVLRGGRGGRTTGCERASNRSAAKLLKLIKFRLCQHCAYAPYAFLPPLPTSFAPWHSEGERTAQPFNFLSDICQTSTDV